MTVIEYCLAFMPVAKALSASVSMSLSFGVGDAARDAEIFQKIVKPRLVLARDVAAAGDGVDHALMEEIGDRDPDERADGRERRGLEEIDPGDPQSVSAGRH